MHKLAHKKSVMFSVFLVNIKNLKLLKLIAVHWLCLGVIQKLCGENFMLSCHLSQCEAVAVLKWFVLVWRYYMFFRLNSAITKVTALRFHLSTTAHTPNTKSEGKLYVRFVFQCSKTLNLTTKIHWRWLSIRFHIPRDRIPEFGRRSTFTPSSWPCTRFNICWFSFT